MCPQKEKNKERQEDAERGKDARTPPRRLCALTGPRLACSLDGR